MGQEHFWNERYAQQAYAYGTLPNEYLKTKIKALNPGTILLPAEGEGRNAVFAALSSWKSEAFDQSEKEKTKHFCWQKTMALPSIILCLVLKRHRMLKTVSMRWHLFMLIFPQNKEGAITVN